MFAVPPFASWPQKRTSIHHPRAMMRVVVAHAAMKTTVTTMMMVLHTTNVEKTRPPPPHYHHHHLCAKRYPISYPRQRPKWIWRRSRQRLWRQMEYYTCLLIIYHHLYHYHLYPLWAITIIIIIILSRHYLQHLHPPLPTIATLRHPHRTGGPRIHRCHRRMNDHQTWWQWQSMQPLLFLPGAAAAMMDVKNASGHGMISSVVKKIWAWDNLAMSTMQHYGNIQRKILH